MSERLTESERLLHVYRAIATIEDSRRTHVEWLDHWRRMKSEGHDDCAHCIETAAVAGGLEHQEKCIEEYDNVLTVLHAHHLAVRGAGEGLAGRVAALADEYAEHTIPTMDRGRVIHDLRALLDPDAQGADEGVGRE